LAAPATCLVASRTRIRRCRFALLLPIADGPLGSVEVAVMGRCIGLDVHRDFAQVAILDDGLLVDAGKVDCRPQALRDWAARELRRDDQVALEATGNSDAIAVLLAPLVARVVVSNPAKTRVIAEAKVKTDKVDARILAQLLAADFLPAVWLPDERTRMLRRLATRRAHLVRQRVRLKNQVQAILFRNMLDRPPVADLFGKRGRFWLQAQPLPADERQTVTALLRQLDFHGEELALVDRELATHALHDDNARRLMSLPGVDVTIAMSIVAAVGDFGRFPTPDKLVAYLGLNPKVRQSGGLAPVRGHISKTGSAHARAMMVEAAWCAARTAGPLHAFYERIRRRRGVQIAIVATARKVTVLCWQLIVKEQDYAFARPSLVAFKQRKLQLAAGAPSARGSRRGVGYDYNHKDVRDHERAVVETAERAYETLVAGWQPRRPNNR
jgi:transposase